MLRTQTQEHIVALTDEELLAYVDMGTDAYDADAVAFAREEFSRRGLTPAQFLVVEQAAKIRVARERANDSAIAHTHLASSGKFLAFLFGWAMVTPIWFFVWLRLDATKQRQKSRDMLRFGFVGLGTAMAIFCGARWHTDGIRPPTPAWMTLAGAGIALVAFLPQWLSDRLRKQRKDAKLCQSCGYDLRATPNRCPECGTVPEATSLIE